MQSALRGRVPAFHWAVEFPEVFYAERPDPLDAMRVNRAAAMDAFVGNPPFLGGSTIWPNLGGEYRDWLLMIHVAAHGNADLCAHFLRMSQRLLGNNGAIGMITTNTVSEGDTRATGLAHILGCPRTIIFDAICSMPWPGDAAVSISVVHIACLRLPVVLTT